jgi:hypothetical protein
MLKIISQIPLIITAVAAVLLVMFKSYVVINNPDEAMGSLLMIYTVSWLLVLMLQQPLKRSWSVLVNSFRFVLTFVKAY